jgi:hypothetical protein
MARACHGSWSVSFELAHLGLPTQPPPMAPARAPPNAHLPFDHPSASHRHRLLPELSESIVLATTWSKPVRTVRELLLVDRLQRHHHRALQHLILERRDSDRPRLRAVALGDMRSSHRRRAVCAGLRSVEQRAEVVLQLRLVLGRGLSVHACCSVLACAAKRLLQPVDVDVTRQGRQRLAGHLPRQFRYPPLFRGDVHGSRVGTARSMSAAPWASRASSTAHARRVSSSCGASPR